MNTAPPPRRTTQKPGRLATGVTRRHFMQTSAVVGTGVLMSPSAQAAPNSLQAYASATSVKPGGTIDFFVRDPQAINNGTTPYGFAITRVGAPDVFMTSGTMVVGNQVVPADASTNGCRWVRTYQLTIPTTWKSGLYYAYIGSGELACTVPFVIRPVSATAGVKLLVQIPVTTVHAYNAYGGKSLYDYNSSNGVRAPRVSLDRPFTEAFNSFFDTYGQYFVRWLDKNGIAADFCTDIDITVEPQILNAYTLYTQAGHDEYWTTSRRRTMDAFVAAGGNAAYFAGNTSWFQIRLEPGNGVPNRSIVCYKDAAADPITDPALKTINFAFLPTPYPENATTGLGFVKGCSWAGPQPRPITPSVVMRAEHWSLAGTGLAKGAGFGGAYVGYESDAADFTLGAADQNAYPTGLDGSPATLRIIASADATGWNAASIALGGSGELSGHAMISVFSRGGSAGTVFNGGSTDWAYGLRPELDGQTPTPLSRITRNVIDKLLVRWAETCDVRQYRSSIGGIANFFYGTATTAPAGSGLALDGWVFRSFPVSVTGSVPVYRYRTAPTDPLQRTWLLSLSATAPAGMVPDGIAFHAWPTARADATPIYEHVAFNSTLQRGVVCYSPSATPPAGYSAGPVRFHAPGEGSSVGAAPPVPTFTLTAAPTLSVVEGYSATTSVTVNKLNGFNASVAFAASGLPPGATASFSPTSSSSSTAVSTLTIQTAYSVTPGTYTVTITGTAAASGNSPAITQTTTVSLIVAAAPPAFALSTAAATLSAVRGQAATTAVNIARASGFSGSVTFTASHLPAGVTARFSPTHATTSTLTLQTSSSTPAGTYTVTITGTSPASAPFDAYTASTTVTLVVTGPPPSFTLTTDENVFMPFGGIFGNTEGVCVNRQNGFNGVVAFSVTGLPSGLTASFSPQSSATETSLRLSASGFGAQRGTFTLTIRGTSGTLQAATTVRLTVL